MREEKGRQRREIERESEREEKERERFALAYKIPFRGPYQTYSAWQCKVFRLTVQCSPPYIAVCSTKRWWWDGGGGGGGGSRISWLLLSPVCTQKTGTMPLQWTTVPGSSAMFEDSSPSPPSRTAMTLLAALLGTEIHFPTNKPFPIIIFSGEPRVVTLISRSLTYAPGSRVPYHHVGRCLILT